jgi:hypothetical protein
LLDRRAIAVLQRDRAGFLATVDASGPDFAARQAAVFDNLANVPVASWAYLVDPAATHAIPADRVTAYGDPVWAPAATLRYSLSGFDDLPTLANEGLTFVHRPTGWLLAADDDFVGTPSATSPELWDDGPVTAVSSTATLVLGHPQDHTAMAAVAMDAEAAIPVVSRVWGPSWVGRAVIVVPSDRGELSRLTGQPADLSQIAALATAGTVDAGGRHEIVGNRIVLNPDNFARLAAPGRRVVLTHELTHLASRSATAGVTPTWLVEGLADYVGYLDSTIPVASAGRELTADLRAGRLPTDLPANAAFDSANPDLPAVYEMSWLACRMIAERTDQAALLRFYRAVGHSTQTTSAAAVDQAMATELHTTPASFTAAWRTYLQTELG